MRKLKFFFAPNSLGATRKHNKISTKNDKKRISRIRSKHSQSEANVKEIDAIMLRLNIDIVEMLCDIDIKWMILRVR